MPAKPKPVRAPIVAPVAPIAILTEPLELSLIGGYGLVSGTIERLSFGPLSHVDSRRASDGWLYGARSGRIGTIPAGVEWRPPGYYGRVREHVVMTLQVPQAVHDGYWAFLEEQKGKPYNSRGILGMLLNRDWRAPDSWFCSELVGRAGEVSKLYPTLFTPTDRVTPVEIALLWSGLGATKQ